VKLTYQQFDLPLKHVFTISRGSMSVQPTIVVQLSISDIHGYGEATTNSFYGATIEKMSASFESVRSFLEGSLLDDPLEFIAGLARRLSGQ
jgi:L-alanine-DL-glutamate epimerase-like enolase superfamily enzyme